MICNKCFHTKTSVLNSRAHKKTAQIWRRRQCSLCKHIFTTYEKVSLPDELQVTKGANSTPYNPGILLISLYEALSAVDDQAKNNVYWLLRTIEDDLVLMGDAISSEQIEQRSHSALSRFNTLAGIQYALKHNLLDQIKRPRRR